MPWFNVDDSFYDHPKVWDAPDCAVALWCRAGSWSARSKNNGFVPSGMPARLCGDPEAAVRELVDRGLWRRVKGGYAFHDWTDWNLSAEQIEHKRKQNAERQRRFREGKKADGKSQEVTPSVTRYVTHDKRVSNGAQSNPDLSLVDVVDHLSRRIAHAYEDDDLRKVIIDSIQNRTRRVITAAHATLIAAEILDGRQVDDMRSYVQRAISREKDPAGRWLRLDPDPSTPSVPDWCGAETCNPNTRRLEDPESGADCGPCAVCHPSKAKTS